MRPSWADDVLSKAGGKRKRTRGRAAWAAWLSTRERSARWTATTARCSCFWLARRNWVPV